MNGKTALSNFTWRLLERFGAQGVTFIVSIVLARLLDPELFGTVALITVFTAILQVFIDSGFGSALIQKKDSDDLDFSTVFFFNMGICILLYIAMFFLAPTIASFYNNRQLTSLVRVASLTLIISGIKGIQQTYVSKYMLFKKFFWATLGGTIGAAAIGIVMACMGFGVWALVVQNLFNQVVDTVILWFTVKWRPKKKFSFYRLRGLLGFGWKIMISSLLETTYTELRQLIIGRLYSSSDLAYYNRGRQFPVLIVTNINTSIGSILFPTLSQEQDNIQRVKAITRRAIKTSTYFIMPMMAGVAACATPLVRFVLSEKWLPSVFYIRIFCLIYAFYPIHTANLSAMKAIGRSDIFLRLEVIKKLIGVCSILISMWISVRAIAWSMLIVSFLNQMINAFPNKKLLGYGYLDQFVDIFPQLFLSLLMGSAVFCVSFFNLSDIVTLLLQFALGVVFYLVGSIVTHNDSFIYSRGIIKQLIPSKKIRG